MTINRKVGNQWYTYSMEYYAAIKRTSYTCNNMNEFEKYYIEQKKPE